MLIADQHWQFIDRAVAQDWSAEVIQQYFEYTNAAKLKAEQQETARKLIVKLSAETGFEAPAEAGVSRCAKRVLHVMIQTLVAAGVVI